MESEWVRLQRAAKRTPERCPTDGLQLPPSEQHDRLQGIEDTTRYNGAYTFN